MLLEVNSPEANLIDCGQTFKNPKGLANVSNQLSPCSLIVFKCSLMTYILKTNGNAIFSSPSITRS